MAPTRELNPKGRLICHLSTKRKTGFEPATGTRELRESASACASVAIAHDTAPALRLRVWR